MTFTIAFDYGVIKSTISDSVAWAERPLIRSGLFCLPLKRKLLETDFLVEVTIADATECEIERPEKTEKLMPPFPGAESILSILTAVLSVSASFLHATGINTKSRLYALFLFVVSLTFNIFLTIPEQIY